MFSLLSEGSGAPHWYVFLAAKCALVLNNIVRGWLRPSHVAPSGCHAELTCLSSCGLLPISIVAAMRCTFGAVNRLAYQPDLNHSALKVVTFKLGVAIECG